MLMGDLNVCIKYLIGDRVEHIADMEDKADLIELSWYFLTWGWTPKQ